MNNSGTLMLLSTLTLVGLAGCDQAEQAVNSTMEQAKQSAGQAIDEATQSLGGLLGQAEEDNPRESSAQGGAHSRQDEEATEPGDEGEDRDD